jgi:putative FmdB family regulatory protein
MRKIPLYIYLLGQRVMPIYTYMCQEPACHKVFDKLVFDVKERDNVICEHCGGKTVRREIYPFGTEGLDHNVQVMPTKT